MKENSRQKYKHSINGLIRNMYYGQVSSSKKRGHLPPEYTCDELVLWVLKQSMFTELFNQWVASGYKTRLIPSVDRLRNDIGYTFDNIQLMSFVGNMKKNHEGRYRNVKQYSLDGKFIAEYKTISSASVALNIPLGCISRVCLGHRNKTGGFKWEFS